MPYMPTKSPALRNYLDQKQYAPGNRYGAGLGGQLNQFNIPQMPGMGMGTPQPPGRMQAPNYQMAGGIGMAPGGGGMRNPFQMPRPSQPTASPLSATDAQRYVDLDRSLYGVPDYEGRHEANEQVKAAYMRMLQQQAAQGPIDYSGSSVISDQYDNQRQMAQDQLAARGISGSGVEAGVLANLYGGEARAVGADMRARQEQRRREQLAQEIAFENYARQIGLMGLQRNWQQQDEPGFLGDALGVLGGVAGSLIPGIGGAIGGAISGIGGNNRQAPINYGDIYNGQNPGLYGPNPYPYVDPNDPWSPGYGGY